ncbi:hypothetical protein RclHR1_22950002 [Rhizophagus clarus]|uniref:F-box domain-containing protein n=1 Tax=Rhizophagus clarus TaxID=94130 RepID=A0A2Z6R8J2_9GLOM|nr:hypothetical protein RclHR1_22950002 [Rhizophagus clarus]GES90217.1 hypothetical protein GLOIN_2v1884233 [Rhizophagus clarus]
MSMLNRDVIFLILEELQNDNKSLYSCLLINRTWCETTIPILWRDPTRHNLTDDACKILFNVILLHLSKESRNNLKNQKINPFIKTYRKPLFNYISFWRHFDLCFLERVMNDFKMKNSKLSIFKDEIIKVLINNVNKLISLSIPESFNSHLFSGIEHCFLELENFYCDSNIKNNILKTLTVMSTRIKKLEINVNIKNTNDPSKIVKLIKVQKNLKEVNIIYDGKISNENFIYRKTLEESLIKCADTVQYLRIDWEPITKFLSYLVDLVSLDLAHIKFSYKNWYNLKKVSLPLLKFLKAQYIPPEILAGIIENTSGHLIEISIYHEDLDDTRLIRAIYQNCLNLSYLNLALSTYSYIEFENLLINCKFLNELEVVAINNNLGWFNWSRLFELLTIFSPINLFKFKFTSINSVWEYRLRDLKLFLSNWKDRRPLLLQIVSKERSCIRRKKQQRRQNRQQKLKELLQEYKAKDVIKKYDIIEDDL